MILGIACLYKIDNVFQSYINASEIHAPKQESCQFLHTVMVTIDQLPMGSGQCFCSPINLIFFCMPHLRLFSLFCFPGAPARNSVTDNHTCVSSCLGVANGDYHSCRGCHFYATCSNEIIYDNRRCPSNLVWDDILKRCEYTSYTCNSNIVAVEFVCFNFLILGGGGKTLN